MRQLQFSLSSQASLLIPSSHLRYISYASVAGIIAKDINVITTMSRALRAGTVWVNTYNVFSHNVPFGGYKMSGIGRDKGEYALQHYTQVKAVYQKLEGEQAWIWCDVNVLDQYTRYRFGGGRSRISQNVQ